MEEMMDDRMLVCLNNGTGTRINLYRNETSCIALTLVNRKIAYRCEWEVDQNTSISSDHFPIYCKIEINVYIQQKYIHHKWCFQKNNWEKYLECCNDEIKTSSCSLDGSIDKRNDSLNIIILKCSKSEYSNQ